jgi:hypothetical protein
MQESREEEEGKIKVKENGNATNLRQHTSSR